MDTLGTKQMEMFIRVVENRAEFPLVTVEGLDGTRLFDDLGLVVEDLRSSAHDQSRHQTSARESSDSAVSSRGQLERKMEAIRRTARILEDESPGVEEKFPSPRDLPAQELLTLARTYGTHAFPLKAQFIKRGVGTDFIAELDAAAAAFDADLDKRAQRRGSRVEATAEIGEVIARGLKLVRELDVIVRNVYAEDPAKLAFWKSVSHVEKPHRRSRRKGDDGAVPTPPPAQG